MRTIAIPVIKNKLSPHFGDCPHFKFYYEKDGIITKEELIPTPVQRPDFIPNWLVEKGVTDVITFGIGQIAINILNRNKVNVFVGVKKKDQKKIMQDYLDGTLETDGNLCDH